MKTKLLRKRFNNKYSSSKNLSTQEKRDRILIDLKVNLKTNDLVFFEHITRRKEFVTEFISNIPFIEGEDEENVGDNYWGVRHDTYNHFFPKSPSSFSNSCFRFELEFYDIGLPTLEIMIPYMKEMEEKYGSDTIIETNRLVVYVPFKNEHTDYYFKDRKSYIEKYGIGDYQKYKL